MIAGTRYVHVFCGTRWSKASTRTKIFRPGTCVAYNATHAYCNCIVFSRAYCILFVLTHVQRYCAEFLVHGVDVEGKRQGTHYHLPNIVHGTPLEHAFPSYIHDSLLTQPAPQE